ncbi:MAG: hypothetical protein IJ419_02520 [Agathobacter sp.]|nr:hypothetical protein [Agathobacter sp.]
MNWMYKLEQKWGRYAIYDLHKYFVIAYLIGFALNFIGGGAFYAYFAFDLQAILAGQVWRLVTWVFCVYKGGGILGLIFMLCLMSMGQSLQHFLGVFRMNVYLIGGVLLNIVGGVLVSLISWIILGEPLPVFLSLYYILLSMFMALAICVPDATVNLYFILPIKMKWMLLVYFLELLYELYNYYNTGSYGIIVGGELLISAKGGITALLVFGSQIIFALLNLFLFFFFANIRLSRKQKKRQREFHSKMREATFQGNGPRHKCAICGKTEADDPNLVFRFCSKCTGNKEYCQDHLFTHTHN